MAYLDEACLFRMRHTVNKQHDINGLLHQSQYIGAIQYDDTAVWFPTTTFTTAKRARRSRRRRRRKRLNMTSLAYLDVAEAGLTFEST